MKAIKFCLLSKQIMNQKDYKGKAFVPLYGSAKFFAIFSTALPQTF